MLTFFQRYHDAIQLLLIALLGLSLGHLAAGGLGAWIAPSPLPRAESAREQAAPARRATLADYGIILQRNIFDSTSPNLQFQGAEEGDSASAAAAANPQVPLALFGTVAAGERSLALIRAAGEVKVYRLGDPVPGGGTLHEVARNQVSIRNPDGSLATLPLYEGERGGRPAPGGASAGEGGIRSVGENRWEVSRLEVDKARANMNDLLRQARLEPNIVDGRAEGFVVRMIQPRSLLSRLGLQVGDVVMQVNGVSLDSPEKALQIFQQLREARQITVSLTRGGTPLSFSYEVN